MKWTDQYKNNRPLLNSALTGVFYFLFCWSLDFGDATKGLFITFMLFLPGLTFPLTTCYYKTKNITNSDIRSIGHLVLSVAIYHGSVWLFSGAGRIAYITVLAFLQYEINGRQALFMGIAVFLWTLVNGLTLNVEYRKSAYR